MIICKKQIRSEGQIKNRIHNKEERKHKQKNTKDFEDVGSVRFISR